MKTIETADNVSTILAAMVNLILISCLLVQYLSCCRKHLHVQSLFISIDNIWTTFFSFLI